MENIQTLKIVVDKSLSFSLTPEQARDILSDIVGFVNRNGLLDDYTKRIEERLNPDHYCTWVLEDVGPSHETMDKGFEGTFYLAAHCQTCWRSIRLHFDVFNGWDFPLYQLCLETRGITLHELHDQFQEAVERHISETKYLPSLVMLFPGDD